MRLNASTTFFSTVPLRCAPVSSPPCPGSMTMTGLYMLSARTCGDTAGRGIGGCRPPAPRAAAPACIKARLALASLASTTDSAGTISSTRCAALPSLPFSTAAFSTITGPVTSMTTRALPGADRPPRNDLTRPTAVSPGCGGSCSMTSGSSTNTRLGLVSENTWNSTGRSRPMMNRVRARVALECGFLVRARGGGLRGLRRRRLLGRCCQGKGSRAERCPKEQ